MVSNRSLSGWWSRFLLGFCAVLLATPALPHCPESHPTSSLSWQHSPGTALELRHSRKHDEHCHQTDPGPLAAYVATASESLFGDRPTQAPELDLAEPAPAAGARDQSARARSTSVDLLSKARTYLITLRLRL